MLSKVFMKPSMNRTASTFYDMIDWQAIIFLSHLSSRIFLLMREEAFERPAGSFPVVPVIVTNCHRRHKQSQVRR